MSQPDSSDDSIAVQRAYAAGELPRAVARERLVAIHGNEPLAEEILSQVDGQSDLVLIDGGVVIEVAAQRAVFRNGAWEASSASLREALEALNVNQYLPAGAIAREAAEILGGRVITESAPSPPEEEHGRPVVY